MEYLKCFEPAFAACGFKMGPTPASCVTVPNDGTVAEGSVAIPDQFQATAEGNVHASISRVDKFDSETARSMEANVNSVEGLKRVAFTCPKVVGSSRITLFVNLGTMEKPMQPKAVAHCTVTIDAAKGTGSVSEWEIAK
jgi:hypothetical protein